MIPRLVARFRSHRARIRQDRAELTYLSSITHAAAVDEGVSL